MAKLSASCLHANFSLLIGNFQKNVYYCLAITLWKCEYYFIWALSKSILFGSDSLNSLKVSVLCDMNFEKLSTIV